MSSMIIKPATLDDLKYIDSLAKGESKSLGFIPKARYEASIVGRRMKEPSQPACNDKLIMCFENDDPVGFVLGSQTKVHQIVLQEDARMLERGKALLKEYIDDSLIKGYRTFSCGCADDLESNVFWKAMGWDKVSERNGIYYGTSKQSSKRKINNYIYVVDGLF